MTDPNDPRHLAGRVALVTGASRGIGRAIAVRLAARGATLACVATSAANCEETLAACREAGAENARAWGVDVADHEAVTSLVGEITAELGGLDVLVNNAGITRDQLLLRMSEEDFDRVIDVNLKGAWSFCRAAARSLMKSSGPRSTGGGDTGGGDAAGRAGGRIVNVSSVVGLTGNAGQSNYAASKAGLIGLTRALA